MAFPRILAALGILLAACSPNTPAADSTAASAPAAATAPTADPAAVRAYIDSANKATWAAAKAGDVAGMMANYADDAMVMGPNEPAKRGRTAIEEGARGMLARVTPDSLAISIDDVQVSGDLAIETGNFEFRGRTKEGASVTDAGKYVVVWRRQPDGSWKIIRDIYNANEPPKP